jgi:sugar lactone lactonase YvrE
MRRIVWWGVAAVAAAAVLGPAALRAQTLEVAGTVTVPDVKLDGVGWDGESIWVITYQSAPIEWRIARLAPDGSIASSFPLPITSRDDVHNLGMTNVTSDGETLWANNWNAGIIYNYSKDGTVLKTFGVASVHQLIPVGIAFDGTNLWVLHWSNKTLYKLDRDGNELGKMSLAKVNPAPNMGLTWDGQNFWVGNSGANRIMRVSPEGKQTATLKGPKPAGNVRDLAWDGQHLLLVYKQDDTVYKLTIRE